MKFIGEISQPLKINRGVRQGNGLFPTLFNRIPDKVERIWNEKLREYKISPIALGRKSKHILR